MQVVGERESNVSWRYTYVTSNPPENAAVSPHIRLAMTATQVRFLTVKPGFLLVELRVGGTVSADQGNSWSTGTVLFIHSFVTIQSGCWGVYGVYRSGGCPQCTVYIYATSNPLGNAAVSPNISLAMTASQMRSSLTDDWCGLFRILNE